MIRVLQQDIIVINSKKIAKDLLDNRSSIYSDRPYLATRDACVCYPPFSALNSLEICLVRFGWAFNFAWTSYGDEWRSSRKLFHQAFRVEAVLAFRPVQLRKARQLVLDILSSPHEFSKHIQK